MKAPTEQPADTVSIMSRGVAKAVSALGSDAFPAALMDALCSLVYSDDMWVTYFGPDPEILLISQKSRPFPEEVELYVDGAFLLDPYYRAARDTGFNGFASYTELCPEGFNESEYYREYLHKGQLVDECGYLVQLGGGKFLNASLDRSHRLSPYSAPELDLLHTLTPLVESLCCAHWARVNPAEEEGRQLTATLDEALGSFGSSKLTPRECEIINYVLRGYSSGAIAERLQISVDTVRIHRSNSYRKLDIGSQSELFHLFISALRRFDVYPGGDPLEGYF